MTTEALPSTLVAATVVRKAKPLAWLVRSAASSRGNRDDASEQERHQDDVGDRPRSRRARSASQPMSCWAAPTATMPVAMTMAK